MGDAAVIALGGLTGGLAALCAREAMLATPRAARWVASALEPLGRAGREGYAPSDAERRRLALLCGGSIFGLVLLVAGPGPLAVAALAGPALATSVIAGRRRRYRRAVESQIPNVATAIADALSAGRSVRGALGAATSSLEGSAATELARVSADLELGESTSGALDGLRRRMDSPRIDAFASAIGSPLLGGGDVAGLMRRFAAAAAEQDRVAQDARSATAQARFTGLLVVALPGGAALFAELLRPGFISSVLSDPTGVAMIGLAAVLQLAGFAAIRRLGRAEE